MPSSVNKRGLVPKLRFPEFREAGEWGSEFGDVLFDQISNKDHNSDLPVLAITQEQGAIPRYLIDYHVSVTEKSIESYKVVEVGDFIISLRSFQGGIEYSNYKGICSPAYVILRLKAGNSADYFKHFLKTSRFITLLTKNLEGLRDGKMVSYKQFSELQLPTPSLKEQQKIADCLASLDERITLEAQKLDTLKTHKKGLMQQLFPAEGETLPKLRFPEFRDAGEWEEKRLGDIGSVRMCKRILKEQTSPRGEIPFYKIGTFGGVPDAYISREIFENFRNSYPFPKNGAVLISAAGTIGRTVRYNGELAYFQDSNIVWLDNSEKLIADIFLFYLYQLIDWSPSVGAIQRLYNENILGAQVKFPSILEQQKIADCLTSLDDLITAQTQKLAALKTHKKGLMQQLFPVLVEATA
jgi:type I restriction enzyme S subunit